MDRLQEIKQQSLDFILDSVIENAKYAFDSYTNGLIKMCESPIEEMFVFALFQDIMSDYLNDPTISISTIIKAKYLTEENYQSQLKKIESNKFIDNFVENKIDKGYIIVPQYKIDKYRVDFLIILYTHSDEVVRKEFFEQIDIDYLFNHFVAKVIVECDGHNYHEKTKEQAKHDKERDRFLQSQGYTVLRFTGSELYKDPFACYKEVKDHLYQIINEKTFHHVLKIHKEVLENELEDLNNSLKEIISIEEHKKYLELIEHQKKLIRINQKFSQGSYIDGLKNSQEIRQKIMET